ncbi:hypothetical protein B5807_05406 [Epicoccum nigrum]|uniref:Uncharacterized protein n=1 Tax=Epicoccum nigrum TaxID=105696 RepID=A0A1Y2LZP9_EPING|nr:hypothetical protein B5807_05406 [Epicoccum nigrum]
MAASNRTRQSLLRGNLDYEEYAALHSLPLGCPSLTFDDNDDPFVHEGEVFCRYADPQTGVLCGLGNRGALRTHLKRQHHYDQIAPSGHGVGQFNSTVRQRVLIWYNAIMTTHRAQAAALQQQQLNLAQAQAPRAPPWPAILLPDGELDLVRMQTASVAVGRESPCAACGLAELDGCDFAVEEGLLCENRDLWMELPGERTPTPPSTPSLPSTISSLSSARNTPLSQRSQEL